MGQKDAEDSYLNLSKKELQCLCKKYGLSPNKKKSNLAKSLVSYLEKKNLSSLSSGKRLRGTQEAFLPTSLMPQLQTGAQLNSISDAKKDSYVVISHPGEDVKKGNYSQALKSNKLDTCMGFETNNKASASDISEGFECSIYNLRKASHSQFAFQSDGNNFIYEKEPPKISSDKKNFGFAREGRVGDMPQIQCRDINFGACPTENAFASSMKSSTKFPSSSFEFYVRSEEGIQLYVDLNASSSDWTMRLKNEVCICQNMQNNKSHGLHQELGRFEDINKQKNHSFLCNTDSGHEINEGHVQAGSLPSLIMTENGCVGFDDPDGDAGSLTSSAIKPFSVAVDMLEHLEEDHTLLFSSRPCSDVQDKMISGTEANPTDEGTFTLDSDVYDTPQIKSASDSAVYLTKDGAKSFDTVEHQNPKLTNGICEESTLQMTCSLVNPSMVYPGCSTSGSVEMQFSEVVSNDKDALHYPCENGIFLDTVDPMNKVEREHGGFSNSRKLNDYTCGRNLPSSAEEWERGDLINGRENLECSQFNNSTEKICLRSDNLESSEGLQKKRQHNDSHDNSGYGKPDAKIFKSTKHHTGEVHPRRSIRLVSKVARFIGEY